MTRKWWVATAAAAVLAALIGYALTSPPAGPRSLREFNPDRVASLELRMWQAYYGKERVRLFALLVTLLREQYRYSWTTAATEGFHLARAAAAFGDMRCSGSPESCAREYETVLPDLEQAYGTAARWLHAGFTPRDVARAELAWWVARRIPGKNDPETVGRLMADSYALLYEAPAGDMARAGLLRAEAAALRDREAASPDWAGIERLLLESYRDLHASLAKVSAD
jgi:hypothetical protein